EHQEEVIDNIATFDTGLPVVKVDVGKNNKDITMVTFKFMNGKPAVISTNPPGFKNTQPFGDEFDLSITGTQTGDVTVFFTAGTSGQYFLAHLKKGVWEFLKAVATDVAGQYKAVFPKESGFSPVQIVSAEPEPSRSSGSSQGTSVWLPATAEPTPVPTTAAQPTQAEPQPTAAPLQPTPQASSPAPFIGLLAGFGAAAALFGLRRR
ncbi:MAG: hypothetical protein MJ006_05335, partial [Methanocorpusculum sp.]|nr:hypothetical protein [Methanocorpusculum sp.]